MHAYLHNIKTFNNATRHLTRVERSLYRDLIELYYDCEQPLPAVDFDRLSRRVLANSDEEKAALRYVLDEFFELTGDCYTHQFCDEQIESYRANQSGKSAAGKASAEARRKKAEERKAQRSSPIKQDLTGVEQTLNECATNHEPLTMNHEPENKNTLVISGEIPNESGDKKNTAVPVSEIVTLFNESFPELPQVQKISDGRRKAIRQRWLQNPEMQTLQSWERFFKYVRRSDFLMGRSKNPWSGFCFDWMFNPSNFNKIYEGNYHQVEAAA